MSTFLTIEWQRQRFDIKIDDDLDINFLDYDIQYDQAAYEFGYSRTPAIDLLERWGKNPVEMIIRYFGLSRNQVVLLAADWAEHVWPIFHKHFPHDKRVREAIIAARKSANSDLNKQSTEAAWYNAMKAINETDTYDNNGGAMYAASSARDVAHASFSDDGWWGLSESTSWYALHAVGHEASTGKIAIDYPGTVAYEAEKAWQVRHGLNVVKYVQGKRSDWPSVEVSL